MPVNFQLVNIKLLTIPGATQMTANGINDHGQVVGQFSDAHGIAHGFIYEDDSFCELDYPDATGTNLLDINNLGQITGTCATLTAAIGFLYDRGVFSPPLAFPSSGGVTPNGLNDRGEIVGVYSGPALQSFHYKAAGYTQLVYPGMKEIAAQCINDSGQIIGSVVDTKGVTRGFIYLDNVGVFAPPIDCRGSISTLRGINNGGQIVGGCIDAHGNEHPFLYMAGGLNPIVIPGALAASTNGVNDHGQVVGNFRDAQGMHSFIASLPF